MDRPKAPQIRTHVTTINIRQVSDNLLLHPLPLSAIWLFCKGTIFFHLRHRFSCSLSFLVEQKLVNVAHESGDIFLQHAWAPPLPVSTGIVFIDRIVISCLWSRGTRFQ